MPYVEKSIIVECDPETVYTVAKDMESYPNFMRDVESVKIVNRDGNETVTEWVTNVDGTPFLWTERDLFDDANHRITYCLIEGDLEKFEGAWTFDEVDGSTKVTLAVDYDFGMPELTAMIGPTLEAKIGENSEMMLSGMKDLVEGRK